MIQKEVAGF